MATSTTPQRKRSRYGKSSEDDPSTPISARSYSRVGHLKTWFLGNE